MRPVPMRKKHPSSGRGRGILPNVTVNGHVMKPCIGYLATRFCPYNEAYYIVAKNHVASADGEVTIWFGCIVHSSEVRDGKIKIHFLDRATGVAVEGWAPSDCLRKLTPYQLAVAVCVNLGKASEQARNWLYSQLNI